MTAPKSTLKHHHNAIAYHRAERHKLQGSVALAALGRVPRQIDDLLTKLMPGSRLKEMINCMLWYLLLCDWEEATTKNRGFWMDLLATKMEANPPFSFKDCNTVGKEAASVETGFCFMLAWQACTRSVGTFSKNSV